MVCVAFEDFSLGESGGFNDAKKVAVRSRYARWAMAEAAPLLKDTHQAQKPPSDKVR